MIDDQPDKADSSQTTPVLKVRPLPDIETRPVSLHTSMASKQVGRRVRVRARDIDSYLCTSSGS